MLSYGIGNLIMIEGVVCMYRACIDTSGNGSLSSCTLLATFKEERQYGTFSDSG